MAKKKDLRSPLAKARDEYFESETGAGLCVGGATGEYLRNRLVRAFIDGWGMCERHLRNKRD
jgi:hypothetical protein